ncbi:hypothetical protein SAMN05421805_10625 [Saccharopolyspora antimicrobica]|uniref:Uncharacterized protein n=1 Tax=Saccharopolyspora antimicrobica TaxID=455193 RepID=A0A1I5AWL0_9PSEU|nr:hypothetical protein [Saccharopolyspora antimicrobica]RKT86384.1 hypothetical protein ATL45_4750 [Saccharopolyspora antimicrobica]SFN66609.1 hypothetical protein SAMN05421805_10625 [Saccharopolyspora antimicrobica]
MTALLSNVDTPLLALARSSYPERHAALPPVQDHRFLVAVHEAFPLLEHAQQRRRDLGAVVHVFRDRSTGAFAVLFQREDGGPDTVKESAGCTLLDQLNQLAGPGPISARSSRGTRLSGPGIALLRGLPRKPATRASLLEHDALSDVLAVAFPGVEHSRSVLGPMIDQHVLSDAASGSGVLVVLTWERREHRTRTEIAECGPRRLWDEFVVCSQEWNTHGRRIPQHWLSGSELADANR